MHSIIMNNEPTMTSRQIAELVESRHDDVKRSIDRLVDRAVISNPPLADGIKSANGVTEKLYIIGKRDSYVIVAQLSPEFTARLVDRWSELEAHAISLPNFNNPAEAARAWAEQYEQKTEAQLALAAARPAIEFVERYVDSTGTKGFREVCKLLKANENEFREFLKSHKVMYKLGGDWGAYSDHIDAGRFLVRAGTNKGNGHAYNSARFTPKGVEWIAGEWAKHQIKEAS